MQEEGHTLEFVKGMLAELKAMVSQHENLSFLSYLIDMAHTEAANLVAKAATRSRRRRVGAQAA